MSIEHVLLRATESLGLETRSRHSTCAHAICPCIYAFYTVLVDVLTYLYIYRGRVRVRVRVRVRECGRER